MQRLIRWLALPLAAMMAFAMVVIWIAGGYVPGFDDMLDKTLKYMNIEGMDTGGDYQSRRR